jgi:Protein of unknown function (DUF2786)
MEQNDVLRKVRALIERAEHPSTPAGEAEQCRATADKLMEKYAIEEWQTAQATGVGAKPTRIKINLGKVDSPFLTETATLAHVVANFCRCSSMWMTGSGYGDREEYAYVYGFESDLRYFEMLFTTLFLHMSGAIFPEPHPEKSLELNAYEMHNAGLNWYDIAQAYGWREVAPLPGEAKHMYKNREGERASWSKAVGRIKSAYAREVKARGEQPLRIPPQGSENFRHNAANGYILRIQQRLDEQLGKRGAGTEIALRDRGPAIRALLEEKHPDASPQSGRNVKFNPEAYARGRRHANSASLNPQAGAAKAGALS